MTLIRIRRGKESERGQILPRLGEPLFTTDSKRLYVGDGVSPGGVPVGTGEAGKGVPAGGDTGQVLVKKSPEAYDTEWQDQASAVTSVNGRAGDVTGLAEQSSLEDHMENMDNPHGVNKEQVGLGNVDDTSDTAKLAAFLPLIYPVGIVLTLGVETNPADLFGFGTWEAIEGRVVVGISNEIEFDTLDETGGAKAHTLTEGEMPSHTHPYDDANRAVPAFSEAANLTGINLGISGSGYRVIGATTANAAGFTITEPRATAVRGGSGAHNNLQPYIVKYVWQRTA